MYQVVDAKGRLIDLEDDEPVPPGCSLHVSTMFMDAEQRAVFSDSGYAISDEDEDEDEDQDEDEGEGDGDGDGEYEITDADRQRVLDARVAYIARISAGMHRHQVTETADDNVVDGEDFDPRRAAYDAMKRRLSNQWKRKARKQRLPVNEEWTR
jgi:hypothetical protein